MVDSADRLPDCSAVRVGLLGPYHSRNLGDTAIQMAVMAGLRNLWPAVEFLGITWDPRDAQQHYQIDAAALLGVSKDEPIAGRDLLRLAPIRGVSDAVASLDLLLISGSGQLDDYWGGPWRHPWALLFWTAIARMHKVPVAVFGIGVDDLSTWLGKRFAFGAMRLANGGFFRDVETLRMVQAAGAGKRYHAGPDPAFGLPVGFPASSESTSDVRPSLMVCPISSKAWMRKPDESYTSYIGAMTLACRKLLKAGAKLRLAYSQKTDDSAVAQQLHNELLSACGTGSDVQVMQIDTVEDFISAAQTSDVVVGSRLHAVILSLTSGTPVVAMSYSRKVRQLMKEVELEEYCINLSDADGPILADTVMDAWRARTKAKKKIGTVLDRYRLALDHEYQWLKEIVDKSRE